MTPASSRDHLAPVMILEPESPCADTSDFWRPRVRMALRGDRLPAGLYRFHLRTRSPAYASLRLWLEGWPASMHIFLDRGDAGHYRKAFSVPRRIVRMELELEPHLDTTVIQSLEMERIGLRALLAGRRDLLGRLASPRALVGKVRQVLAGRSALAFTGAGADERAVYGAWQLAFEGPAERQRIAEALAELGRGKKPKLLLVDPRIESLPQCSDGEVGIAPLEADADMLSLSFILDAAEAADAFAFVLHDRPGCWSAQGLTMLAVELLRHPDCLAAYGDSDRLEADGRRARPDFKPDWSPRFQQATDYVRSAVAFRVDGILRHLAGGLPAQPAASRGMLSLPSDLGWARSAVRHVPRVVFHESCDAGLRQPGPEVAAAAPRPRRPRPSVSVIMPTQDNPRLLRKAVRSVLDEPVPDLELIVVDNGARSARQTALLEHLRRDARARVIGDARPFNFSVLVNAGVAASRGEVLVLLNDDVHARERGWLGALADVAAEARAGCVGALLLYPSGRIQHAGVVLGMLGVAGHVFRHLRPEMPAPARRLAAVHEVGAATAACLAVRREVFDAAGGFDEALPVTLNDVDFCLRVRALGYDIRMAPHVRLVHHESASRGRDVSPEQAERQARETALFLARWEHALSDPFYSPHLALGEEVGGLRGI